MKLPSLEHILRESAYTLKRFPLTLITATIAAVTGVCIIEFSLDEAYYLFNIIFACIPGIPLFIVIQLTAEKRDWSSITAILTKGAACIILLLYYFLLPNNYDFAPDLHFYRYALYLVGIHLLVSVGPFWGKDEMSAFWQYNKTLFLSILTAAFFSGVLFLGLAVALLSIDALLGINIEDETYFQLFILLAGIFNTWFFLARIPKSVDRFNRVEDYPNGLKIFTQNILIPLVILYMAILYLYTGKILVQWFWPEGWVANLILSFSIVGILAILLLYPIQEHVENRWIKPFSKSYFWSLVPLVMLLLLAIWRRIWEYGFTVERYFVLILGFWLTGVVIYFAFNKTKNIKVIPASLCLTAFLISFGPWGAFSVSQQSQLHRLQGYLQQHEILKNGTVRPVSASLAFEDRKEISSIIRYLITTHGIEGLQPWFEQDLAKLTAEWGDSTRIIRLDEKPEKIVELMGLKYVSRWEGRDMEQEQRFFTSEKQDVLPVTNFDWLINDIYFYEADNIKEISIDGKTLVVEPRPQSLDITLYFSGDKRTVLTIPVEKLINQLQKEYFSKNYNIPQEEMTVTDSTDNWGAKLYFRKIAWKGENKTKMLSELHFDLLLSFKHK